MSDEVPTHKRCSKCGEMKLLEAFHKQGHGKYGKRAHCKDCAALYRASNAEKYREYNRAYYQDNIDRLLIKNREYARLNVEKRRAYRAANVERIRERDRVYRIANADAIRARFRMRWLADSEKYTRRAREWHAANTSKLYADDPNHPTLQRRRAYARAYYAANLDAYRVARHRRRARIKGNGGTFTVGELKAMRIECAGICFYCRSQHEPNDLTIDHVIPIVQGGRHEAANIVLACERCNKSKNNRTLEQWVKRWYERKKRTSEE
jgi:5-methylcytosine-specific restriction endonuclease McrA